MTCKNIIALVALFAIAAAVEQDPRHPPHQHGHHHHDSVPIHINPEVAPTNTAVEQPLPIQEEIVEDGQNDIEAQQDELDDERKFNLKSRQEETESETEEAQTEMGNKATWVDCDYNLSPRKSCFDCHTRIICKFPGGGKLVGCNNMLKPYCNNGICSAVPTAGCA